MLGATLPYIFGSSDTVSSTSQRTPTSGVSSPARSNCPEAAEASVNCLAVDDKCNTASSRNTKSRISESTGKAAEPRGHVRRHLVNMLQALSDVVTVDADGSAGLMDGPPVVVNAAGSRSSARKSSADKRWGLSCGSASFCCFSRSITATMLPGSADTSGFFALAIMTLGNAGVGAATAGAGAGAATGAAAPVGTPRPPVNGSHAAPPLPIREPMLLCMFPHIAPMLCPIGVERTSSGTRRMRSGICVPSRNVATSFVKLLQLLRKRS
jgi:hypothetical protein